MFNLTTSAPSSAETELSQVKAASLLRISRGVLKKGLACGTIPNLSMSTIAEIANRQVIEQLDLAGVDVPVLRLAAYSDPIEDWDRAQRPFAGWRTDATREEQEMAVDRWWEEPGRDLVTTAGGYLVACGSIICGVARLDSDEVEWATVGGTRRLKYDATLVGRLSVNGPEVSTDDEWGSIADSVLGLRVLGGRGGLFARID